MSHYWKRYWALVAVTLGVYLAMASWTLPFIGAEAGGLRPFDMRLTGYSFEEAITFLTAISDAGRTTYLTTQRYLDMIYPALMALMLSIPLYHHLAKPWSLLLVSVVFAASDFDYLENWAVAGLLAMDPSDITPDLVATANHFTQAKAALTTIAIFTLFGVLLVKWVRPKRARA